MFTGKSGVSVRYPDAVASVCGFDGKASRIRESLSAIPAVCQSLGGPAFQRHINFGEGGNRHVDSFPGVPVNGGRRLGFPLSGKSMVEGVQDFGGGPNNLLTT
jgi:hypothetical protein